MDYAKLIQMRDKFINIKATLPEASVRSFEKSFDIEYTHNSTAIEGNTLTLIQTKALLEDKLSVGGKSLREIYEVVNHDKALQYIKACIAQKEPLNEIKAKDIHAILMENILIGGVYRNCEVRITGAKHKPPSPGFMYMQIKDFFAGLPYKTDLNPIELAAYTHAEFVKIHPFEDGNGRASRLIMNYQLMANNFLPVSINKEDRIPYFEALEEYAINSNLTQFAEMIAVLEEKQLRDYISIIPENERKEDTLDRIIENSQTEQSNSKKKTNRNQDDIER